jgi:predicted nucleic acid-binding protein
MKKYSVISNSTPLIAFIKKNELSLLKNLFDEIIIPRAVYNEIINIPKGLNQEKKVLDEEINKHWILIKDLKALKFPELNLGKGETEALNICLNLNNPLLLIDEKKSRNIAISLNIDILGTLGILAIMKKKGIKNEQQLLENLDFLIQKNFYFSSEIILAFLQEIKK